MMKFYDTSALLNEIPKEEYFVTSSIVLNELENIKTSKNKAEDVKLKARQLTSWLLANSDKYDVVVCSNRDYDTLRLKGLIENNDNLIVATAYRYQSERNESVVYITNDIVSSLIARNNFQLNVEVPLRKRGEKYSGFCTVKMTDEKLASFYSGDVKPEDYQLKTNEYLVVQNVDGEEIDVRKATDDGFLPLYNKTLQSVEFGSKIKPKDTYQRMVIDSIITNQVTAITGQAGSGKTLLALVVAMSLISSKKYDRLVILFNPTSVRGAAQLGFYSGNMFEKAMQTNIGNILTTKFGDKYAVEMAVQNNRIKLISMADQRGFEVADNEILFITEAQNTSVDLLKLCLSRVSEGAKVIIEGDYEAQVDNSLFEGQANGLRRAIEVMAGNEIFGFVELQNVWRSKLCELVQNM